MFYTTNRYSHQQDTSYHDDDTCVFIPKQCVMYYRKRFTPDILNHMWYGIHTIWVHVYTQVELLVVHVHTRNKFIHTEIEQFILCCKNITLNLVSSHSNLATWRCIMTPTTHTNDTDTHEETGRNSHSWRKTLLLSLCVLSPGQTRHLCDFLLHPPHPPVPF